MIYLWIFEIRFQNLTIVPTLDATRELIKNDKDLYDVLDILKNGVDYSASKRKKNIVEKALIRKNKLYKAVVAKVEVSHPNGSCEFVWKLIHFGKTTYKKRKSKK